MLAEYMHEERANHQASKYGKYTLYTKQFWRERFYDFAALNKIYVQQKKDFKIFISFLFKIMIFE